MSKTKTTKQTKKAAKPKAKAAAKKAADKPTGQAPRSEMTIEEAAKFDAKRKAKETKPAKPLDPNRCATPRCKGEVALTHLGKPLCQKCWERQCQTEDDGAKAATEVAGDAAVEATPEGDAKPKGKRSRKGAADDSPGGIAMTVFRNQAVVDQAQAKAKREKKSGNDKPKRVSAIDAAAQILQAAGKPMRSQELIAAMTEQGLWSSPAGKTPHATLYSAILREIGTKGDASRFAKVERGLFEFNAAAAN
jgi:hypothetical protein